MCTYSKCDLFFILQCLKTMLDVVGLEGKTTSIHCVVFLLSCKTNQISILQQYVAVNIIVMCVCRHLLALKEARLV